MNSQRLIFAASVGGAVIVAFVAGRATSPDAEAADRGETSPPPPRVERPDRPSASGPGGTGRIDRARVDSSRSPVESAVDEMASIIREKDRLFRAQAWLDFINTLEPGQFEEVVDEFRSRGFTEDNMSEYAMLLTAWAKTDPLSALDYASENTGNAFARNTILATWAGSDPNGAIAWAERNHDGEDANPWMVGVIRGLAGNDPARATALMEDLPYSRERGQALATLLPEMLGQGEDVAKDWVLGITDERLKDGAIARLAETLGREDPAGAAEWLLDNPGEGARRSMDDVLGMWARDDTAQATSYFESLPSGELRTSALRGLASQIALDDPGAAARLLDRHAADANDRVYQQFVWRSRRGDPALAANYIGRIEDVERRDRTYRRVLGRWMRDDLDGAANWIRSAELPENVAERVQRDLRRRSQ